MRAYRVAGFLVMLAALFGLTSCKSREIPWPVVSVEQSNLDFGSIREGESIIKYYTVRNTGTAPLRIIEVDPRSRSLEALSMDEELKPGQSTGIRVAFDSTDRFGKQRLRVLLHTNAPDDFLHNLYFIGNVIADFEAEPGIFIAKRNRKDRHQFLGNGKLINRSDKTMRILKIGMESGLGKVTVADTKSLPLNLEPGQSVSFNLDLPWKLFSRHREDRLIVTVADRERPIGIRVRRSR